MSSGSKQNIRHSREISTLPTTKREEAANLSHVSCALAGVSHSTDANEDKSDFHVCLEGPSLVTHERQPREVLAGKAQQLQLTLHRDKQRKKANRN